MKFTVALCQMAGSEDKSTSMKTAEEFAVRAADQGADVVVLPEMWNCPYANEYFRPYAEPADGESVHFMNGLARRLGVYLIGGSIPELDDGRVYNSCFSFDRHGDFLGKHRKAHLFDIDVEGGMRFKESDTLTAGDTATVIETEFGKILVDSYVGFGSDFIIRSALILYGDVVKSTISRKIAEELKNNWTAFKKALKNLESVLKGMKIEVSRFSSSWNVLLPVLYYIYYNPESYADNTEAIRAYLMRAILFTYFQSGTTGKLQQMKSNINSYDYEITVEMLDQITDLRVTDGKIEDILNAEKGSRVAGDALYYLCLDWTNKNFKYEQDHLHPYERFDGNKPVSVSMEDWRRWRGNRNRLPNLQLLEGRSNGSKSAMPLIDYYNDMNAEQQEEFRRQAMIPEGVPLGIEHFEEFYSKRKDILAKRIKVLLG